MRKYLLRYLFFWFPAAVVAYFFNNSSMVSLVLLWFTAFFMLFGWAVNTGMAAYNYPRATLSALLTYTGFHILINVMMFTEGSESTFGSLLWKYGGILSFKPLDIIVQTLKPFRIPWPWTLIVTGILVACCILGFLFGLVQRRIHPNPYRPRIRRSKA